MRTISLSKKPAYSEFMKLDTNTRDKLKQCLEADIRARTKSLKADKFTPLFPDAHRWIKNGQYEQYLLTVDKKPPTLKRLGNTPFYIPNEKTESLHQMTQTGFDSAQWRNLDEEIDKNLEEHFKKFASK